MQRKTIASLLLLASTSASCAAPANVGLDQADADRGDEQVEGAESSLAARLNAMAPDLGEGDEGADVEALQDYLAARGYLPSDFFRSDFPLWRPVLETAPTRGMFDAVTTAAVLELQERSGLEPTGIVDAATHALIIQAHCGVPESQEIEQSRQKWAIIDGNRRWGPWLLGDTVTWRVTNTNDVTLAQARAIVQTAFARWSAVAAIDFQEVTSGEEITITFETLAPPNDIFAGLTTPDGTSGAYTHNTIRFNSSKTWTTVHPAPSGQTSLQVFAIHEIGHAIGIHHDAKTTTAMFAGPTTNVLSADDKVAATALYDEFQNESGSLNHISAGPGTSVASVWGITKTPSAGGFTIVKRTGSTWTTVPGGALKVAVAPDGIPWVLNDAGVIFRRSTSSTTGGVWNIMPGAAKDIAIGADGSVWVIGTNAVAGGFGIHKWNGTSWSPAPGGAVQVAVGPTGVPWVSNDSGHVFRFTTNQPNTGSWTLVSGPTVDLIAARDISIGPDGAVWMLGTPNTGLNARLYVRNEQTGNTVANIPARNQWYWVQAIISGNVLSAGSSIAGGVWVVKSEGNVYHEVRTN